MFFVVVVVAEMTDYVMPLVPMEGVAWPPDYYTPVVWQASMTRPVTLTPGSTVLCIFEPVHAPSLQKWTSCCHQVRQENRHVLSLMLEYSPCRGDESYLLTREVLLITLLEHPAFSSNLQVIHKTKGEQLFRWLCASDSENDSDDHRSSSPLKAPSPQKTKQHRYHPYDRSDSDEDPVLPCPFK